MPRAHALGQGLPLHELREEPPDKGVARACGWVMRGVCVGGFEGWKECVGDEWVF